MKDILNTATQAAVDAGKLMKVNRNFFSKAERLVLRHTDPCPQRARAQDKVGAAVTKTKLSNKDLLTEIDPQCQRIIESLVRERFPDHLFLGEESVPPGAEESAAALRRGRAHARLAAFAL